MSRFIVKVNPDTSSELQWFAFKYGWMWPVNDQIVRYTNEPYLVLEPETNLIFWGRTNHDNHPEITLEYAKKVITNHSCPSCKLNDQYTAKYSGGDTFTVDGTQYPVKLVDDLLEASKGPKIKPCYIKVDPELSAALQRIGFNNSYAWSGDRTTPVIADFNYLGIQSYNSKPRFFTLSHPAFADNNPDFGKEVSLKKFLKRLTRKSKNAKITLPTGENVQFKGDKIHVGCQVFEKSALDRLDSLTKERKANEV